MADKPTDLLMKFNAGADVAAGSTTVLDGKDTLLQDFQAGKFFEVDDFDLGFQLNEFASDRVENAPGKTALVAAGKFANWRAPRAAGSPPPKIEYPVEMDPFSITRNIDKASPILFQSCANQRSFTSASLVKRKAAGPTAGLQGFLRLDFTGVLIVSISWDDGDFVKEKCKFICRGMTLQYRMQASDGTLSAAKSASWEQAMALRQPPAG